MLKITNYKNKIIFLSVIWILLLTAVSIWSVFTGQYPLTIKGLLDGDNNDAYGVFPSPLTTCNYGNYWRIWSLNCRLCLPAGI